MGVSYSWMFRCDSENCQRARYVPAVWLDTVVCKVDVPDIPKGWALHEDKIYCKECIEKFYLEQ